MKTALILGSPFLFFVSAAVSFFSLGYLECLRVPFPHWLDATCLIAPAAFIGTALVGRRLSPWRCLCIAGGCGCCTAAIPYLVFVANTESVVLSRVMSVPEEKLLADLTRGRFIVWDPSSPHSSMLLPTDADGNAAKRFLMEHGFR